MTTKTKLKFIRYTIGIIALVVWYICKENNGNPIVQECAGILAIILLFGKLIWKCLFHSSTTPKSNIDSQPRQEAAIPTRVTMAKPETLSKIRGGGTLGEGLVPFPDQDVVFYNRDGEPILLLVKDTFFDIKGNAWAFINKAGAIFACNKNGQIGWYRNHWFYDNDGCCLFFCNKSIGGPIKSPTLPTTPWLPTSTAVSHYPTISSAQPIFRDCWSSL